MKSPNPECENECRFREYNHGTTLAYYPPVYDKYGNNINPDRNVTSGEIHCSVCSKVWWFRTQLGETTYEPARENI